VPLARSVATTVHQTLNNYISGSGLCYKKRLVCGCAETHYFCYLTSIL
jgi:hypothetical protein